MCTVWSNILSVIPKYLPLTLEAINIVKIKRPGGGWWWKVATNFNVSSRQGLKLLGLSP